MPLAETLLIAVGPAVAKTALKRWLEDDDYARDAGVAIVDMLKGKVPDLLTRNKAERDFKRVAEQVAEQLEPFLEIEARDLPENEQEAAAFAVADTFDQARITHELLFENDLDPKALAAHLQEDSPKAAKDLSEAGTGLYKKMLGECATYVVEITSTLPSFAHQSASEMLKREGQIVELVKKVLVELPKLRAEVNGEDADRTFENDYRRAIARKLDRLELFGITTDETSRRYSLSVAYITLTAAKAAESRAGEPVDDDDENGIDYLRVDDALSCSQRVLIRGEAGSGKTTRLQWIAVRAARQDFSDALQDWNGQLPFFLQLRRWLKDGLPKPQNYLDQITPNLTDAMPNGWVTRQLNAGAVLLVDGIDEVPDDRRESVKDWIDDLASEFPACRIVVTSRPAAAEEGWLSAEGFHDAELQLMERDDIEALVDQWHEAAHTEESDEEKRDQLDDYRDSLKATIRANRSLRHLATTPLLCAMICTLHLDRRKNVPGDRMELYRVALDMMLDRREAERGSAFPEFKNLSKRAKESLLRNFAYWLMLNDRSDAERIEAESCLARAQPSLADVDYEPAKLLQFLLERSGLLREPVKDRIDFIHRTFQEFLAAKQAIDEDHVDRLVNNAHLAEWRETIILAAGHGSQRDCNKLIGGLLDRAKKEQKLKHQLILLAVGCLETTTNLTSAYREQTGNVLAEIMPPQNVTEARAVASAGNLAIPYLKTEGKTRAPIVKACIVALESIGSDEAIEALKGYADDSRRTVVIPLFNALANHDALHHMASVEKLDLKEQSWNSLPALGRLSRLQSLDLSGCGSLTDLSGLQGLSSLQGLSLFLCLSLKDLSGLQGLSRLQALDLSFCEGLTDVSDLQGLSSLQSLNLNWCESLKDLTPLHHLPNLKTIKGISRSQLEEFPPDHPVRR